MAHGWDVSAGLLAGTCNRRPLSVACSVASAETRIQTEAKLGHLLHADHC